MDKEIVEGNKLIAEFMGYKYFEANVHDDGGGRMDNVYSKVPILVEVYDECKYFGSLPNPDFKKEKPEKWNPEFGLLGWRTLNWSEHIYGVLKYHTSWDWLMPVVEKINGICTTQLNNYSNDHSFVILLPDGKYWDNCPQGGKPDRIWGKSNTMKDAVYKTVIQFINWYNQNKQP